MIGSSPALRRVLDVADRVARSCATVLIVGESGTGKELLARRIHERSGRPRFVSVNCAAMPRELVESELFGHERGAFTGAVARRVGRFELAHGGTLLLDEVSEVDLGTQAKLLRVLQEHEVDRLGGMKPVAVDVRTIATSNRDLRSMVDAGTFRLDLYHRLRVVPIVVPPLRERREDIPRLAQVFLDRFAPLPGAMTLSREAIGRLLGHPWPGNVRELEHAMQRAALLAIGKTVTPGDLMLGQEDCAEPEVADPFIEHLVGVPLHEVERRLVMATLRHTGENATQAARLLGISRRGLSYKLAAWARGEVPYEAPGREATLADRVEDS